MILRNQTGISFGGPAGVILIGALFLSLCSVAAAQATPTTYYVDCEQGIDSSAGTSPASPWKTLDKINALTLAPGDSVLLKRGTRCQGVLRPRGSGRPGEPISLGAYGNGPLPVVVNSAVGGETRGQGGSGQTTEILPTLMLFNQQYWHIRNLELVGGTPWGLYISGDKGVLRHFRITDVVVRDVTGKPRDKRSGLVAVLGGSPEQTFEDVVLEGITAYGTTQWAGIVVDGGHPPLPRGADGKTPATLKAKDVTVRNCLVHDTAGDGIVLFRVRNGLLESNVAWATGMMPSKDPEGPENPNSIWVWRCEKCVVQYNEGFLSESEGVDGGVYDIDWGSHRNVVQYNYGHDSQGYCISVFGAGGGTTTDSIVRYNVCANNGRSARLAERQGDLYLSTWGGGSLDGVEIYNNTFYWNPPVDAPFLKNDAQFVGNRPNFFKNNLVLSSVPALVDSNRSLELDHNLYWYPGPRLPEWRYGEQLHSELAAFRESGGQEAKGLFLDPLLETSAKTFSLPFHPAAGSPAVDRGLDVPGGPAFDFFGRSVPHGKGNDIGAVESVPADPGIPSATQAPAMRGEDVLKRPYDWPPGHGWLLMTVIPTGVFQEQDQSIARSFAVALRSLAWQHERDGLQAALVISGQGRRPDALENLPYDWDLRAIRVIRDQDRKLAAAFEVNDRPVTVLISPGRKIVGRWEGRSNPARLGLALRWLLGPPPGMAPIRAAAFGLELPGTICSNDLQNRSRRIGPANPDRPRPAQISSSQLTGF